MTADNDYSEHDSETKETFHKSPVRFGDCVSNENDRLLTRAALLFPRRYVPLTVWVIVVLVIIVIPLKIISYGYLPGDDALRHAARAVSGKPWSEILVLNPVYKIDHEFGWNWLLGRIHVLGNWNADALVIFSVVFLFVLLNIAGLAWLKRPEAWLVVLAASTILALVPVRFMLGRPYLITVAALMAILFLWRMRRGVPPRRLEFLLMTALITCSVFFHGAWYLWALPIGSFFLAGEFLWGFAFGVCWFAGVIVGSALTGHLFEYPVQALQLAHLAVGAHMTQRTMASELQPFGGDTLTLVALGGLVIARTVVKINSVPLTRDPAFWLAAVCWVLAFKVSRFWLDWGWPALMVLAASDVELLLETRFAPDSFKRLGLVCGVALAAYLCLASDTGSRWTKDLTTQYLKADDPDLKGWMPDKGGIFYTVEMPIFYQTFFENPNGDWRYMLGFEPTWMPKSDFEVYQKILWNFNDGKAYAPWVEQMTPADRLAVRGAGAAPGIEGLEWKYAAGGIWLGRLPRTNGVTEPVKGGR
jgi:hypothetical protein